MAVKVVKADQASVASGSLGHISVERTTSDKSCHPVAPHSSGLALGPRTSVIPGVNADDALLETLGYKGELKREFSALELFGVSFSIMSVAPSIASVLANQLPAGGVGLSWGWFVPCFFILSIGITMSEMASAMPTAGGLYWWTYLFAPKKWKSYLSFLCGYTDSLGLLASLGSINYGAAQQILASVNLGTGYTASNGVTFAVYIGVGLIQLALGFVPSRFIARTQIVTIVLNFVCVALVSIALPVGMLAQGKQLNSASFVFGDKTNYTNYPYGMAFLLAWMSPVWTISSQDSCVHMAEEASNAATAVPLGILMSVVLCSGLGWVIVCVLAACIDPSKDGMNKLMNAGSPMAYIIQYALNDKWAVGIMSLFAFVQITMGLNSMLSASRQVYAFARDDALPFSRWLKVTTKGQLPIPATIFTMAVVFILGFLILAGTTAANAIFSLANAALYLGWCLPIFVYAFSSERITSPGPFYLGHTLSKINAVIASAFGILIIFGIGMIPSDIPVTDSTSMNYTCLVCGVVWIAASLYWLIDARKWYHGPKMTLENDAALCEVIEAKEWEAAEANPEKIATEKARARS